MRMAAIGAFQYFNDLPKELRMLIWEYHFESARIHVVHPAPESQNRNPKREALLFNCTVLDSATNLIILDGRPPSSLINREAHAVALSRKRVWTPVRFGKDLAESVTSGRARVPIHFTLVASSTMTLPEHNETCTQAPPVYVDWDSDMLYLCVSHAEQAFWSMRSVPWRDRVRKLAVLVPQSEFDRAIPFGPTDPIREVLEFMTELEELYIVLVPDAAYVAAATIPSLSRDTFGFVPYVEYLSAAGLASNHILYTRTAMSFGEAINGMHRKIILRRVVDVDYRACGFGYYRRTPSPPVVVNGDRFS
ncbi:uncharacterized protein F4822DRAFT_265596 [Hypoxylon trugodes]|uniref:uncharacterized protein n=1 Tax=Hypoxylon trugodes TaxID=326681 RepID=UPI00219BE655|nr:uncharacterized protein F4822DRAFT_265596 [Hypoxylon trugodes]KAI1389006.1 hypothetical protein F4822DRAFT_265596 [Hypoxylon trugodes]